jgi:signal transduction histidine kinase/CheY-like chemotaxis protein
MHHWLDTEGFMPHGMCLLWRPELLVLHAGSDLLIALSYYSIPLALIFFIMKRTDVEFRWMFALFGAFILACGTTHLFKIWTLWNPDYLIDGAIKALTAAISLPTAIILWRVMPEALAIPSKEAVEAINRDLESQVHQRRLAERALRRLNVDLEQRVQERTADLERANAALKSEMAERGQAEEKLRQAQKMEAIGQLTGGIAHDFNNLLAVVIGHLELMEEAPAVMADAVLTDCTTTALRSAYRGAELTERLLAFARKQSLNPEPVDVSAIVGSMGSLLTRALGERIKIKLVAADTDAVAVVDQSFLESAILNLALNARDAMPSGGTLILETAVCRFAQAQTTVGGESMPPGDYIRISMRDSGKGMSSDVAARAFEPFFTTKEFGRGSGLGLSMVYGFVHQSNGYITLDSEVGKGTNLSLYLPRVAGSRLAAPASPGIAAEPGGVMTGTVLIVEDDPDVRRFVANTVRALGFEVLEASDGASAFDVLNAGRSINVLITDVVLPGGLNGPDIVRQAQVQRPGLRVLYMSGYSDAASSAGFELPAEKLIRKPFRKGQIAALLMQAMRGGA